MLNKTLAIGGVFAVAALVTVDVVYNQGLRKVQGVVVEQPSGLRSDGPPVVGARVEYQEEGATTTQVTTTDDKGRFEFALGRRGIITASKSGLAPISLGWPPRRQAGWALEIVLPRAATLRGAVYDLSSQQSVREGDVTVTVYHPANLVSSEAPVEGGAFTMEGLPPGPAILVAHAEGFAPHFSSLTIEAGKTRTVRVGLLLDGEVKGKVLDADGNPAESADLHVEYNSEFLAGEILVSFVGGFTFTDEDGAFSVNGIVPGEAFGLYAEGEDGSRSETLNLTTTPGIPLEGVVLRLR